LASPTLATFGGQLPFPAIKKTALGVNQTPRAGKNQMNKRQPKFTPKRLPSQTGMANLFWIRNVRSGEWVLGRIEHYKNGRPKSGWIEEKRVVPPNRPFTEAELLASLAQAESDLMFELSAGDRPLPERGKR
jgi:hypothetical protein